MEENKWAVLISLPTAVISLAIISSSLHVQYNIVFLNVSYAVLGSALLIAATSFMNYQIIKRRDMRDLLNLKAEIVVYAKLFLILKIDDDEVKLQHIKEFLLQLNDSIRKLQYGLRKFYSGLFFPNRKYFYEAHKEVHDRSIETNNWFMYFSDKESQETVKNINFQKLIQDLTQIEKTQNLLNLFYKTPRKHAPHINESDSNYDDMLNRLDSEAAEKYIKKDY